VSRPTAALLALTLLLILGFSACGSSSSHPIAVSLTSSVTGNAIDQGQTVVITASVANDSKNAGVQWSVSGGGTLTAQTMTSVTYNAPASVTTTFTATIAATSISNTADTSSLQIKVNPLPTIATTTLTSATAGTAYNATLAVSGGSSPYNWTVTSGTLPIGLILNSTTGVIAGTPTGGGGGSIIFQVTDAAGKSATQTISFTVNPPPALTISTTTLPQATNGIAYSAQVTAAGGVPPYTWSLSGNPAWLSINPKTGALSGTPTGTTTSTVTFTVTVTDSETPTPVSKSASLSITSIQPPLAITTTGLPGASINNPYSQTVQAIGGTPPYTWTIITGALPAGVTLNAATGVISGTPTGTGTFNFTVKVTDPVSATATANLSIVVGSTLTITTTSLPGGSVGTAYSATLKATGGAQPYTWSVSGGTLPPGLTLNSSSGVISGTPTTTGTSNFTIQVTDSESPSLAEGVNFSIVISPASCPNNNILNGNYAFETNGWSSTTPTAVSAAGSFVANGSGKITTGLLDVADQSTQSAPKSGTFTGSYCVSTNNLATINLTYGGALSGGDTFVAALDSNDSNGHIISYDSSSVKVSGLLRQQTTSAFATSKITGNFAFGLVGADQGEYRIAEAGEFSSDGKGTLAGENDNNDLGNLQTSQTLTSSDFTVASTGRGTATLTTNGGNINYVFYVVSPTEMLMMAVDISQTPSIILAGQVLAQSSTSFTDAALDGTSVIELQSVGSAVNEPIAAAGLFVTTGTATYTLNADQNQAGTMSTLAESGTYSVAANGRVVLTPTGGGSTRVLYLVAPNQAFIVGTNAGVDFGTVEPQTANASLSGVYLGGSQQPQSSSVNEEADSFNFTGATLSATSDQNNTGGPTSQTISASYSGTVTLPTGRQVVTQSSTAILYLYPISSTQFVALPVASVQNPNTEPKLIDFHQ
jgi:hypothetical protein